MNSASWLIKRVYLNDGEVIIKIIMTLESHLYKLQDVSYDFDYCSKFVKSKIVKYVPLNVFPVG